MKNKKSNCHDSSLRGVSIYNPFAPGAQAQGELRGSVVGKSSDSHKAVWQRQMQRQALRSGICGSPDRPSTPTLKI